MISVANLSVSFDNLKVLKEVNIEVKENQIIALIGPSGCGKSTLLRAVAGIIPGMIPATLEGEITVFGLSPAKILPGSIDMIFQVSSLLPWLKAIENVKLGLDILKERKEMSPQDLLKRVGLDGFAGSRPHQLSGGMRQRINLASSIITQPKILLMDEPFANLDNLTRESMWRLIEQLRQQGLIKSAIMVTHSIEEATALADVVYAMSSNPGRILGSIEVDLPRPRFNNGLFLSDFGVVANQIRSFLFNGSG